MYRIQRRFLHEEGATLRMAHAERLKTLRISERRKLIDDSRARSFGSTNFERVVSGTTAEVAEAREPVLEAGN